MSSTFKAKLPGRCAGCATPIKPGDSIRMYDHRAWHFKCAQKHAPWKIEHARREAREARP